MAKNIFQAKKRVSHFQKTHKDLDGENELLGCKDYVSSIIQDMDSNFSYIQSGYSRRGIEHNTTQFTIPEDSFLSIPVLQIPEASSRKTVQISENHSKTKKFSFSRKFPLMEKSQKILKQLKHNQNIPKPRAHLAGIPKSPAKSRAKSTSSKISVAKKKTHNIKNKVIRNPDCKAPTNPPTNLNIKSPNLSKISKNGPATKRSKTKKVADNTTGKIDTPMIIDTNTETNSILEFDSSSSDSEYERFVKKNKEDLPKKSSKRQKQNSRKNKPCTKSLKRKNLVNVSEQKNALNCDNVTESSRNSKISPFKKAKITEDIADLNSDSNCSDHQAMPDMSTRDSSSESDDDSVATSMTQQMISKTSEVKPQSETIFLSRAKSSKSYQNLIESESNNSNLVSSNDETQIVNSGLEVKSTGKTISNANLPQSQSCQNLHILESNINSDVVQSELLNETLINSIKLERDCLPSNLVIDICDSDDESNNVELNASELYSSENVLSTSINNTSKSLADPDSEESDIEIIEVKNTVQMVDKSSAFMLVNVPDILNVVSSEKQLVTENIGVDVKPSIKTENLSNKSLVNISPVVKSQNDAEIDDKHDVVYRTDICRTKMIYEHRTVINSYNSKSQNVPSKGSFQANPDLAVVKHELDTDDDIIILDSVHLPSAKKENIKLEPSTSDSKLTLFDSVDSGSKIDVTTERGEKCQDVVPVSSTDLLRLYKMEFETLLEMKQANADVEASLKNLQERQREKLMYVRSLLQKCVKGSDDTQSLEIQQGENQKNSTTFFSVNVQNNCDSTPNNSFSLNPQVTVSPSTVVLDIKSDVSKLKEEIQPVAIKSEIESDQENHNSTKIIPKIESDDKQTLKLLDEKCSVCGKDAVAACQNCAKMFFCSHDCGRKSWIEGHYKVCGKK